MFIYSQDITTVRLRHNYTKQFCKTALFLKRPGPNTITKSLSVFKLHIISYNVKRKYNVTHTLATSQHPPLTLTVIHSKKYGSVRPPGCKINLYKEVYAGQVYTTNLSLSLTIIHADKAKLQYSQEPPNRSCEPLVSFDFSVHF